MNSEKEMSSASFNTSAKDVMQRVEALDWNHISQDLNSHGNAIIESLISSNDCDTLVNLYSEEGIFRSRVVMEQHGFGQGEYKYFSYPLPDNIISQSGGTPEGTLPIPLQVAVNLSLILFRC